MPTEPPQRVILLRADAATKPAFGAPCNGCGLCCAAAPCPLGVLVSRRRRGRCRALIWDRQQALYRCAMVSAPARVLRWLPLWARGLVARGSRRWISSASGCDATIEVERR